MGCSAGFSAVAASSVGDFQSPQIFDADQGRHRLAAAQHQHALAAEGHTADELGELGFHLAGINGKGHWLHS